MMNVNFFEKKKTNILPYIIGGVFLLCLLLMGGYFFLMRTSYEQTIKENDDWMNTHIEEVALSSQIQQVDQLSSQAVSVQESLNENQYPLDIVVGAIAEAIPNEINRVSSFQLTEPNQIVLLLENTQTGMGQTIVENVEDLSFVTRVQFLNATSQNNENNQLQFELIVDLDEAAIIEEETE